MSVTGELAASVQLCFVLFEASSQAELNIRDVVLIGQVAAVLQPVLVRMQKTLVQSESSPEDNQLLPAVSAVHSSLVGLHEAALATKVNHWLMRLLLARDVRHQLTAALKAAAAALRNLAPAAEHLLDTLHVRQLSSLVDQLSAHRVTKHDHLESLGRGLFKHMLDERTDTQQLPAMLRFAVKEAAKHSSTGKTNGSAGSSSSASGSSGGSKGGARPQMSPGERSLVDYYLLAAIQQLAEQKCGSEQLVLYQIITVLEELKEAKCHERHRRQRQQQQQHLQRVSEAGDGADDFSISAVPAGHDSHTASHDDETEVSANSNGDQHSFDTAISQTMMQFEQMLLTDPYDTVALTQLLEMLLQVEAAAAESESSSDNWNDHNGSHAADRPNSSSSAVSAQSALPAVGNGGDDTITRVCFEVQQVHQPPSSNKSSKLSGLRSAARAALSFKGSSSSTNGCGNSSRHQKQLDATAAAAAAEAAERVAQQERLLLLQQHKQAWQRRVHNLSTAVLDVFLHLTPQPADMDSFVGAAAGSTSGGGGSSSSSSSSGGSSTSSSCVMPVSRDGVCTEAGHSLASGLMSHPDSILALSGCLWAWPDVAIKAARLLGILLLSGPALAAAAMPYSNSSSSDSVNAEVFVKFFRMLNGSDESVAASSSKLWGGLVHLLHSSDALAAGVAAEAVAAIAGSNALTQLCSGPAAIQIKDQLIFLVTQVEQHPMTAGAAAQALHALSDHLLRPAMNKVMVASFWDSLGPEISATADARVRTVCSSIVKAVQCSDVLASTRAASLLVMLVRDVGWTNRSAEWAQCFTAGCSLLAAGIGNNSNGRGRLRANRAHTQAVADSRARAHGAALLAALISCYDSNEKPSPMLAAHLEPVAQDELLLQALDLNIQQFGMSSSWHDLRILQLCIESASSHRHCCTTEASAAVQLLYCLLLWLPADVCVMPELHQVVVPVVEHLVATESGMLQQLALQAQQQLVA